MRRLPCTAIALLPLYFLKPPDICAAHRPERSNAGGVLNRLNIASFDGSSQTSIKAMATDASGNLFVTGATGATGATGSASFPVKNAAQPAFGDARVLRSNDLGKTWTRAGSPPEDVGAVAPDPVAPLVLFSSGAKGVYRSTDGGQTWSTVYQGAMLSGYVIIDPGNHLRLAALTSTGKLIRSVDGGQTWSAGATNPTAISGVFLADPNGSGAILAGAAPLVISRDWGLTFQFLAPPGGWVQAVAFVPSHPGWIYVGGAYGVLGTLSFSTDFGATWATKASPGSSAIESLAVDPDHPNTLVVATLNGLYKSTDDAGSWTPLSTMIGAVPPGSQPPFVYVPERCSPGGGLLVLLPFTGQVAFTPDYGTTLEYQQLSHVTSVQIGPGCTVYATRQLTTDAFVAKLTPDGQTLWATYLGGLDQDTPAALTLDAQGNVYVTGSTASPDFPATAPRIGPAGNSSAFVAKYSPAGTLMYSVLFGGEASNTATAIAIDPGQNAYVIGSTNSGQFPVTPGTLGSPPAQNYTGFLTKLSPNAELIYAAYLGALAGGIVVASDEQPVISAYANNGTPPGVLLMKLDRTASRVLTSTYVQGTGGLPLPALGTDATGNLFLISGTDGYPPSGPITPGAYLQPPPRSGCAGVKFIYFGQGLSVTKLRGSDWQTIYSTFLTAPCGIEAGMIAVSNSGRIAIPVATGQEFPQHNPLLAGPACSTNSSAVAILSADGSKLDFGTYLDDCGVPGVAFANDGSLYAGVYHSYSGPAGVLRVPTTTRAAISIDRISNAFSGDSSAVAGGGLYTIEGSGFNPPAIDLGIAPAQDLPFELGGIQVRFDGVPAAILKTASGRVIVVPPSNLHPTRGADVIAVQLFANGVTSNEILIPAVDSLPGLLTPNALTPQSSTARGYVRNEDGTLNDTDHPAAAGSTITLYATGMGATDPPVAPGSVAHSTSIVPVKGVYSTWTHASPGTPPPPPEPVSSIPGFLSAIFEIHVKVPDSITNFGMPQSNGTQLAYIGVLFQPQVYVYPAVSNSVGVYVK